MLGGGGNVFEGGVFGGGGGVFEGGVFGGGTVPLLQIWKKTNPNGG